MGVRAFVSSRLHRRGGPYAAGVTSPPLPESALPAGRLAEWLTDTESVLAGDGEADVPCGRCTACCTSSQFVHVGPDELDAIAHIPAALLFPAPGAPPGHRLLGYDEHGHCPMLVAGTCSIYEHRPRTCRDYDCRVLAATAVELEPGDKPAIATQVGRWVFDLGPDDHDAVLSEALRAAALYLDGRRHLPAAVTPRSPTERAVLAVAAHRSFLAPAAGVDGEDGPALEAVVAEIERARGRPPR